MRGEFWGSRSMEVQVGVISGAGESPRARASSRRTSGEGSWASWSSEVGG